MMKKFKIRNKIVSQNTESFIISEIGINHEGSFDRCIKMIDESKKSGADAIKLQTIDPNLSYAKNSKSYREFKNTNFNDEQLFNLVKLTKKKKLFFISTPGSFEEIDKLTRFNCDAIKISSGLMTNYPLIYYASKTKKPIIISTGMAFFDEIKMAIKFCYQNKNVALLKCTSVYPAKDTQLNLKSIFSFQKKFKQLIGYSDHTIDDLSCIAAVINGAKIIEKHFSLTPEKRGKDHKISLNPKNFSLMVEKIRRVEKMLGNEKIMPVSEEILNRKYFHRTLVAKKTISINEKFNSENLTIKRLKKNRFDNLKPLFYFSILGKKSNRRILEDAPLTKNDIKKKN